MIQNDIKYLLELLLDFVKIEYQRSYQDRKQLHDEEWEAEEQEFSILGETEIRADAVIGIVRNYLFNQNFDTKEAQKVLGKYSIYDSKVLMSWLSEHTRSYIQFIAYLHAIEHLRLVALENFRKINEPDEKPVTSQKIMMTAAPIDGTAIKLSWLLSPFSKGGILNLMAVSLDGTSLNPVKFSLGLKGTPVTPVSKKSPDSATLHPGYI